MFLPDCRWEKWLWRTEGGRDGMTTQILKSLLVSHFYQKVLLTLHLLFPCRMMNTEITQAEIDWLCRAVEQKIQMSMLCPRDFVVLSRSIARDVGDTLSSTTLKRIWGYLSDGTRPQWSSLSVLARYVGFSSWAQFHHFYHSKITPPPRCRFCKLKMSKIRSSIHFELRIFLSFWDSFSCFVDRTL